MTEDYLAYVDDYDDYDADFLEKMVEDDRQRQRDWWLVEKACGYDRGFVQR